MAGRLASLLLAAFVPLSPLKTFFEVLAATVDSIPIGAQGAVSFVWRPGTPNPSGNVFATWATLYAALSAVRGLKTVLVDTTVAPAVVPAGTYNLRSVTLQGFNQSIPPTTVRLDDGVNLVDILGLTRIRVETFTTGATQFSFTEPNPNFGLESASIEPQTAFPPIQYFLAGSPSLQIGLIRGGSLGNGVDAALDLGATGQALIFLENTAALADDAVVGAVGSSLYLVYSDGATLPNALSGFAGTLIKSPLPPLSANVLYVATNGNDFSGDGSPQRPLATLQAALNLSSDNTTIIMRPGTYASAQIPTTPPRSNLSIQGEGLVTIVDNGALGAALLLLADATSANSIQSLRLQNLRLQGDLGLRINDTNVFSDSFLADGLFLTNCILSGIFSLSLNRANQFTLQGCKLVGDAQINQCGVGRWTGTDTQGNVEFNFDSSAAGPLGGVDIKVDSSQFALLQLTGSPTLFFGKEVNVGEMNVSPREQAGATMSLIFQGISGEIIVDYLSTDTVSHSLNFNQCEVDFFDSFFDSNPAAARQAVSMRSAVALSANAGDEVDLDLDGSSNDIAGASGVAPSIGGVRRSFTENVNPSLGVTPLVFTTPLTDSNYTVYFQLNDQGTVVVSNQTRFGFDYAGSVATSGKATILPIHF